MIQGSDTMDRPLGRRKGRQRRLAAYAVGGVALLAAAGWFAPRATRWWKSERTISLARIRVAEVTRGGIERDLSVQGRVVAAFHPTSFSPVSGIVKLQVRAGEVVERGQVLAVVDSPELGSRLEQERSRLLSVEGELERARIEAKQKLLRSRQAVDLAALAQEAARRAMARAEQSREDGIINDVEFETAEDELRRSELALTHARQDAELERETLEFEVGTREHDAQRQRLAVAELERQVEELSVRTPVAGLVSRLDVEDRDAVTPGQPLVTVVDLSAFEIEVLIPEAYMDEIGPGTPAAVRWGDAEFAGRVRAVSPEVESGRVRGIVAFSDRTPDGLRQNQRVSTRLILESRSDVLKVQRGPFLEAGGGRRAFVVHGDTAVRSDIRIGATSVSEVEVLEGLEAGDRIIISDMTRYEEAERLFLRE